MSIIMCWLGKKAGKARLLCKGERKWEKLITSIFKMKFIMLNFNENDVCCRANKALFFYFFPVFILRNPIIIRR